MDKISVVVLNEAHSNPAGMQLFLAKLTQRGHSIKEADDLLRMYNECVEGPIRTSAAIRNLAGMPHGTIKRFAPITIAIVGASRRFLAQARTNQVGIDYVSASLQYSDYSGEGQFVVPYALTEADNKNPEFKLTKYYLDTCNYAMEGYKSIAGDTDNDTAGYAAPQGLRNILIMQGNHQSWDYFIRLRSCNRNTVETQYVALRIWDALLNTADGHDLFAFAGPDCLHGRCREGSMSCDTYFMRGALSRRAEKKCLSVPRAIILYKFPLLSSVVDYE